MVILVGGLVAFLLSDHENQNLLVNTAKQISACMTTQREVDDPIGIDSIACYGSKWPSEVQ